MVRPGAAAGMCSRERQPAAAAGSRSAGGACPSCRRLTNRRLLLSSTCLGPTGRAAAGRRCRLWRVHPDQVAPHVSVGRCCPLRRSPCRRQHPRRSTHVAERSHPAACPSPACLPPARLPQRRLLCSLPAPPAGPPAASPQPLHHGAGDFQRRRGWRARVHGGPAGAGRGGPGALAWLPPLHVPWRRCLPLASAAAGAPLAAATHTLPTPPRSPPLARTDAAGARAFPRCARPSLLRPLPSPASPASLAAGARAPAVCQPASAEEDQEAAGEGGAVSLLAITRFRRRMLCFWSRRGRWRRGGRGCDGPSPGLPLPTRVLQLAGSPPLAPLNSSRPAPACAPNLTAGRRLPPRWWLPRRQRRRLLLRRWWSRRRRWWSRLRRQRRRRRRLR